MTASGWMTGVPTRAGKTGVAPGVAVGGRRVTVATSVVVASEVAEGKGVAEGTGVSDGTGQAVGVGKGWLEQAERHKTRRDKPRMRRDRIMWKAFTKI